MSSYPLDIERLLYQDEDGRTIGLDEVQLLDPVPVGRIAPVRALLGGDDLYLAYQAALVLTAWGDAAGLDKIEEFVDTRVDRKMEFAPHRIYDYDNVYDELAEAVYLFGLSSVDHQADRVRVFRKLLALYGPCSFESGLKRSLLRVDFPDLAPDVRAALERALEMGRVYLASQLLPPLARWEGEAVRPLLERVLSAPREPRRPDPLLNVVEALGYLPGPDSRLRLRQYQRSQDQAVSDEASRALARLASAPPAG